MEAGVDGLICSNAVVVFFGREALHKNGIAAVQGDHEVLVTAGGTGVEAASVVSEDVRERDLT